MSTETLPAPVAVWDPNDFCGVFYCNYAEASAWAIEHPPDANNTLLAEFYLIDAPFAIVHTAKLDEAGRHYCDLATRQLAVNDPATVILSELPPEHLR